jgi:hypothetical protein
MIENHHFKYDHYSKIYLSLLQVIYVKNFGIREHVGKDEN